MAKDGLKGLWVGWGPNVMRNSVINAAEIASYDQFKNFEERGNTFRHLINNLGIIST